MNTFTISQLSMYSGIKQHTIRMWEQRYNALNPTRSEGNTRYYDNIQLRRLLNIVSLMGSGHKISELCAMPDEQLFQLIVDLNLAAPNDITEYFITQLISAGLNYDEVHFEKILFHCMLRYKLKDCYVKVLYPMLIRIGLMWATDSLPPAHEHFISNLLRQKFFTVIDTLSPPKPKSDTWLLFLPEDELHEIGLLFAHALIRLAGDKVIYLGANVPFQSLAGAISNTKPDNLLLFLVHQDLAADTQEYCNQLSHDFKGKRIYIAGNEKLISQIKLTKKLQWLQSVETLVEKLSFIDV